MFFNFPPAATADNWLGDVLSRHLIGALDSFEAGTAPVPLLESLGRAHREILAVYPAIQERWSALIVAMGVLTQDERKILRRAIHTQNDIPDIFVDGKACIHCRQEVTAHPILVAA